MALSKHPIMAIMPTMRMPEDKPRAKKSNGISSINPKANVIHPIIARVLPIIISNWQLNDFEKFTRNPNTLVAAMANII
jgi:hypothetical protein